MTAFRISRATRAKLEVSEIVVGSAVQPPWLRWDYEKGRIMPVRADSPWAVDLYPDVPFPTINAEKLAIGIGDTPDEAVERGLSHPDIKYRSRLDRAFYELTNELRSLEWCIRMALQRHERGSAPVTRYDDLDDDISF